MTYTLDAGQIFTLFFVMLGPLKLMAPFAYVTRSLDPAQLQKLALHAIIVASLAMVGGGFFGMALAMKWSVSVPVLMLTGGIIFFIVSLQGILKQFAPRSPETPASPSTPTATQIAFPMVITPYGMAALIVLLTSSHEQSRTLEIIGIALGVMVLNLLTMLYVRPILKFIGPTILEALFAVLGMLVAALALQIIVSSLSQIGIFKV